MTDPHPDEVTPDPAIEASAEERVLEAIARERQAEAPAEEATLREAERDIERQEDAQGLNGLLGRIRSALRRR